MTQIERYRYLLEHWKARAEVTKWRNKLYAAEIAEQLAKEE